MKGNVKGFLLVGFIIFILALASGAWVPGGIYGTTVTGTCVMLSDNTCQVHGGLIGGRIYELTKGDNNELIPIPGIYGLCRVESYPEVPCSVLPKDTIITYQRKSGGSIKTFTQDMSGDVKIGATIGDTHSEIDIILYNAQPPVDYQDVPDPVMLPPAVDTPSQNVFEKFVGFLQYLWSLIMGLVS